MLLERRILSNDKEGNGFHITTKKRLFTIKMQPMQKQRCFSQSSSSTQNDGPKTHELLKQPANYIEQYLQAVGG